MENKDTAYLSNKDGFTTFSYGGYDFRLTDDCSYSKM